MPESDLPTGVSSGDDGVGVMVVGTVLWLVAAIGCLFAQEWLRERGDSWWLLASWLGFGMGIIGIVFTRRRARAYEVYRRAAVEEGHDDRGPAHSR